MKIRQYSIILILLIVSSFYSYSQTKPAICNCPNSSYYHPTQAKPDSVFYFTNGRAIMLCGERDADTVPNTFSDFILAVCGVDTIIDYWYEECGDTYLIKHHGDTLLVEDIIYLPTGNDFRFEPTLWATDKIYFQGSKLVKKLVVNRQIPKRNKEEIEKALKLFEAAELNDSTIDIAKKLFIAAVSGSHKARKYFKEFKTKFGELDGAFAEDYENLTAMLALWDDKKY